MVISRERWLAILGTLIAHLLLGIAFVFVKMQDVPAVERQIIIDVVHDKEEIEQEELKKKELLQDLSEKEQIALNEMVKEMMTAEKRSNVAVNVSEKFKTTISTDEYLKQLQSEISANNPQSSSGLSGGNIITDESSSDKSDKNDRPSVNNNQSNSSKEKVSFKGKTNIFFDLEGRREIRLVVPVYRCEGAGKVVVEITVNQKGEVSTASVDRTQSDMDECLQQAAQTAAIRSRFNADYNAAARQKGTITYMFVAQY